MKRIIGILLAVLLVTSCAPMPGNALLDGLQSPTSIEDVVVTITRGSEEASQNCNRLFLAQGSYGMVFANCVLNACVWMGCADVQWDAQGNIKTCDVYVSSDIFLEHELRHCLGYADVFY